jgi:hypothetical protein
MMLVAQDCPQVTGRGVEDRDDAGSLRTAAALPLQEPGGHMTVKVAHPCSHADLT